ncbi:hypothetical protein KO493_09350 [Tamlana agarivorans]|uniref:Uncharacterized protein n=1 Tax=Pseudotamlana agarivorans TaxID=481183 RepID=A0ACC5U9J8_9FLAO|nr:hypothetical protein [Tamlana agarivorans]MBU2950903.1 hypothetical protein [Tamlana agarivorans]
MKNQFLTVLLLLFFQCIFAQKTIYYPEIHGDMNFSAEITKIEVNEVETIIHFFVRQGEAFLIPVVTHIVEESNAEVKLHISKAVGVNMNEHIVVTNPEGMVFKLYFPPLSDDVKQISYIENLNWSNGWYIKNIAISSDDVSVIKGGVSRGVKTMSPSITTSKIQRKKVNLEALPKEFYGHWHDKYGTLIAIATPEFLLYNFKIYRYRKIIKKGKTLTLKTSGGDFDVLKHAKVSLTIRYDKIVNLKRDFREIGMPEDLKGVWKHHVRAKTIKVSDTYFYKDDTIAPHIDKIENNRIIDIGSSKSGDVLWFLVDNGSSYNALKVEKRESEYVLSITGFPNAVYYKNKNKI